MNVYRPLPVACAILALCAYASEPLIDWVRQVESANHLVETGDFDKAAAVYASALDHARAAGDDLRAAVVLQNLGRMLDRRGHLREAEKAYLGGISALERVGAADDRIMVRAAVGLSAVYLQSGQYSKAETLIKRVLASHPAGAGSDEASLMGNLGVVLTHKQQFAEAEQLLRKTAGVCASNPDTEIQEVGAVALANLAGLQMRIGRTADAIESYQRAVAIMEALPNPSPATFAVTLADYAKAVRGNGDRKTAENLYLRAIAVAGAQLGKNHVVLGQLLQSYAELVQEAGRKAEARELAQAARRIQSESDRENIAGHTVEVNTFLRRK
jgi:tetratricopeptide (TPR) repeat protein